MVTDLPMLAAPLAVSCSGTVLIGAVDIGNPSFLGSGVMGGVLFDTLGVYSSSLRLLFHIGENPPLVYKGWPEMANRSFATRSFALGSPGRTHAVLVL